jgi:NADH dehydrogenase/NADH:ubiquinone oxidoreductase subunit G
MINLTIDGSPVLAHEGSTVLEAARSVGIHIPTLCDDPGLSAYGACRICTVEVRSGRKTSLEASCTLPAKNGQVVFTNSERVKKARKVILELLLSTCPTSKTLQDMASNFGVNEIRFKIKDTNCILCGLCVRYCREQMRSGGIGFIGRGTSRRVATAFAVTPEECRNCGGCEWICPVCERACTAENLVNGLCGGCQNRAPVETCTVCVGCSQSVGAEGHKVY